MSTSAYCGKCNVYYHQDMEHKCSSVDLKHEIDRLRGENKRMCSRVERMVAFTKQATVEKMDEMVGNARDADGRVWEEYYYELWCELRGFLSDTASQALASTQESKGGRR